MLTPADLALAQQCGLVDSQGRFTHAGRVLVGDARPAREPIAEWTMRWLKERGPMNWNPRPPGFKEE